MLILNEQNFEEEVLKAKIPVVVDFYADWCGPCQMAGPVLEELTKEYKGKVKLAKLNVDENQPLSVKYSVMSIPCVIAFFQGKEADRLVGFPGREGYLHMIEKVIK